MKQTLHSWTSRLQQIRPEIFCQKGTMFSGLKKGRLPPNGVARKQEVLYKQRN